MRVVSRLGWIVAAVAVCAIACGSGTTSTSGPADGAPADGEDTSGRGSSASGGMVSGSTPSGGAGSAGASGPVDGSTQDDSGQDYQSPTVDHFDPLLTSSVAAYCSLSHGGAEAPRVAYRKTAIAMPEELLADVDRAANARGESRSAYIARVLAVAVRARRDAEITKKLDALFADDRLASSGSERGVPVAPSRRH